MLGIGYSLSHWLAGGTRFQVALRLPWRRAAALAKLSNNLA